MNATQQYLKPAHFRLARSCHRKATEDDCKEACHGGSRASGDSLCSKFFVAQIPVRLVPGVLHKGLEFCREPLEQEFETTKQSQMMKVQKVVITNDESSESYDYKTLSEQRGRQWAYPENPRRVEICIIPTCQRAVVPLSGQAKPVWTHQEVCGSAKRSTTSVRRHECSSMPRSTIIRLW